MNDPSPTPEDGHLLHQAEVPPLDVDGVQAATVGTVIFAVATVIMAVMYERLVGTDDAWWLGVGVSGFVLGVIGIAYTSRRRARRRRRPGTPD